MLRHTDINCFKQMCSAFSFIAETSGCLKALEPVDMFCRLGYHQQNDICHSIILSHGPSDSVASHTIQSEITCKLLTSSFTNKMKAFLSFSE